MNVEKHSQDISQFPIKLDGSAFYVQGKALIGPLDLELRADHGPIMVIGPNGAGKTSFLKLIHGLVQASTGSVIFNCKQESALKHQSFVFQTPHLLRRTVLANLVFPLHLRGYSKAQAIDLANRASEEIGLQHKLRQSALTLSGGEKQLLALARALITKPEFLLLDEPTAYLDLRATAKLEARLKQAEREGVMILMATHDLAQAKRMGRMIMMLDHGRVVEYATANDFFNLSQNEIVRAFIEGRLPHDETPS